MPIAQCKEDHYSSTGYQPCQECGKGYYQPLKGQTNCLNCTKESTNLRCLSGTYVHTINNSIIMHFNISDCHLPPYTGPCNNNFQRYFYNKTSRQCETFTFGGCKPNNNNFYYHYDCENKCGGNNTILTDSIIIIIYTECPPSCSFEFCILNRFNICSM